VKNSCPPQPATLNYDYPSLSKNREIFNLNDKKNTQQATGNAAETV
jgi:hypothetical protein